MFPARPRGLSAKTPTAAPSQSPYPSLVLQASDESGQPAALVNASVVGWSSQIRNMDKAQAAILIQFELDRIAESYGARLEAGPAVLSECTQLVLSKFAGLGVNEIREAYRMKAAGELHIPKGKGEMWGGVFDAGQLGAVLSAYMEQRRKALGAYLRRRQEDAEKAEKERNARERQAEFDRRFPDIIARMQASAKDWRDCPAHLYEGAKRRGLFRFDSIQEAHDIFQDALALARLEKEGAYQEALERGGAGMFRLRELKLEASSQEGIESRAKVIARQITLFRKLCIRK